MSRSAASTSGSISSGSIRASRTLTEGPPTKLRTLALSHLAPLTAGPRRARSGRHHLSLRERSKNAAAPYPSRTGRCSWRRFSGEGNRAGTPRSPLVGRHPEPRGEIDAVLHRHLAHLAPVLDAHTAGPAGRLTPEMADAQLPFRVGGGPSGSIPVAPVHPPLRRAPQRNAVQVAAAGGTGIEHREALIP